VSERRAVPLDLLQRANAGQLDGTGQPLCPACLTGRLHPYRIDIHLGDFAGTRRLTGWLAKCVGNRDANVAKAQMYEKAGEPAPQTFDIEPCGFSMPMTAH
jgi:hypothetical protein